MSGALITVHSSQQAAQDWAGAMALQGHQVISIQGPFGSVKLDNHRTSPVQDHGYIGGGQCWIVLTSAT